MSPSITLGGATFGTPAYWWDDGNTGIGNGNLTTYLKPPTTTTDYTPTSNFLGFNKGTIGASLTNQALKSSSPPH